MSEKLGSDLSYEFVFLSFWQYSAANATRNGLRFLLKTIQTKAVFLSQSSNHKKRMSGAAWKFESAYVGTLSWCGKSKWLFGFFSWKAVNCGFTAVDTQKIYILQTSKNPTCYCIFALQLPECPWMGGLFLQCHRNAVHRTGKRSAGTLLDWLATCQLIKSQPLVTGSNISTVPR